MLPRNQPTAEEHAALIVLIVIARYMTTSRTIFQGGTKELQIAFARIALVYKR
jgi:hypothetical protein